ncbi:MAG: ATP-binding protein, partial [Thermodesulfovibrionales bacterium]|nr:ATP-binding protein [Thermodesulfovibrionales bacterium]
SDSSVIVSVIDEGPGIPEGQIDRLFKPFSKTSVKTTGGEKSTGLGLVISRKIIESHNGSIWAQNGIKKGAIFSFSLPKV